MSAAEKEPIMDHTSANVSFMMRPRIVIAGDHALLREAFQAATRVRYGTRW